MARPEFLKAVLVASVLLVFASISTREAAAEWEEMPVVPTLEPPVADHLKKIAGRAERLGNNPAVFAKIGDSITASPSFMQGLACRAPRLGTWNELRETLEFFGETSVPRASRKPSAWSPTAIRGSA